MESSYQHDVYQREVEPQRVPAVVYDSDSIPSWKEEYLYCALCLAAATGLIILLWRYDGEVEPKLGAGLELSTVVIAIMTVFRVALSAIVETALSQGAWIWVSAARQRRKKTEPARLEDFKMFDEASRGLLGSLSLVWRPRGTHLACVGAGIIVLIHGFETFSQEMVTYAEQPTPMINLTNSLAPPPARSETWNNIVAKGFGGDQDLGLSTKAAFYDGIMASTISDLPVFCGTANCTWPVFPTLAVCGNCSETHYQQSCSTSNSCTYSTASGTFVVSPSGGSTGYRFTVAPTNTSADGPDTATQSYFSSFDIMSVSKSHTSASVEAYQCALWFCLHTYQVTVINGQQTTVLLGNWSKAEFSAASSSHNDEYYFTDIPSKMNVSPGTRYSVSMESIEVLGSFMASKMLGNSSNVDNQADYSSDWVQAMQNASSDLSAWMSRLTLSMTNDIRLSGSTDHNNRQSQYQYTGIAYVQAPYIQVEWRWVVYPISLMVLAFLYLAQTVWRTARDQVAAWKGDSLPMLFAHIDKGIHEVVRDGMDRPGGLNDQIGRTQVELVRRQNGQWLFKLPQRQVKRRQLVITDSSDEEF
ncbi:hypothetical protein JX265_006068 [Neoarthrinium moseri]|uniref:Uncharacterized protein n=1 Tax=Neoarthrinium moseri TaxID=1658444 RepID=A0A9P9WMM5_9PEZI|nr:hypothetical protein JX265_006068 [Neoarthrinium moseri]